MPTPDQFAGPARRRAADVEIRPICPQDKGALVEGFERLSERSRYRRFLAPHGRLTEAELRYLTDVDHHDHEALVAVDPVTLRGVGVARYIRSTENRHEAEVAVAVADDWQGHGVGRRLTSALADRGRDEGITSFTALFLAGNQPILNLLGHLGRLRDVHSERGTTELTVDLPERGLGHLAGLLRTCAETELTPLSSLLRSTKAVGAMAQRHHLYPSAKDSDPERER